MLAKKNRLAKTTILFSMSVFMTFYGNFNAVTIGKTGKIGSVSRLKPAWSIFASNQLFNADKKDRKELQEPAEG